MTHPSINIFNYIYLFSHVCTCMEVREQLLGIDSFLTLYGFQRPNLSHKVATSTLAHIILSSLAHIPLLNKLVLGLA